MRFRRYVVQAQSEGTGGSCETISASCGQAAAAARTKKWRDAGQLGRPRPANVSFFAAAINAAI